MNATKFGQLLSQDVSGWKRILHTVGGSAEMDKSLKPIFTNQNQQEKPTWLSVIKQSGLYYLHLSGFDRQKKKVVVRCFMKYF